MKKLLAILLSLAMVFSFAACGGGESSDAEDSGKTNNSQKSPDVVDTFSFTETVVMDNAECLVKITGIESNDDGGVTLKAYFENKNATRTFMFSVDSAAVNGLGCDPFFACEVAPGKKINEEIEFTEYSFDQAHIDKYTDIRLDMSVYDSNDWEFDRFETTVSVYPYGVDAATQYVREAQPNDQVLVDNEYVTVICTGYEEADEWSAYKVNLYFVNKTDNEVMFAADYVSVNGFMADPYYANSVISNCSEYSSISWTEEEFDKNGITVVESIEMTMRAYNEDDWSASDYFSEVINLYP